MLIDDIVNGIKEDLEKGKYVRYLITHENFDTIKSNIDQICNLYKSTYNKLLFHKISKIGIYFSEDQSQIPND